MKRCEDRQPKFVISAATIAPSNDLQDRAAGVVWKEQGRERLQQSSESWGGRVQLGSERWRWVLEASARPKRLHEHRDLVLT